eukprot:342556_1
MTDYTPLSITKDHQFAKAHSSVGHSKFYKTEFLMIQLDEPIQNVMTERNSSVIIEPQSLRGQKHVFSFKCNCHANIHIKEQIDRLKRGDILMFTDQVFGMHTLNNESYYLHIGITQQTLENRMKMYIIKTHKTLDKSAIAVLDGVKWRTVTNREYKIIINKLRGFKKWNAKLSETFTLPDTVDVDACIRDDIISNPDVVSNNETVIQTIQTIQNDLGDSASEYDLTEQDLDRLIAEAELENIELEGKLSKYRKERTNKIDRKRKREERACVDYGGLSKRRLNEGTLPVSYGNII